MNKQAVIKLSPRHPGLILIRKDKIERGRHNRCDFLVDNRVLLKYRNDSLKTSNLFTLLNDMVVILCPTGFWKYMSPGKSTMKLERSDLEETPAFRKQAMTEPTRLKEDLALKET